MREMSTPEDLAPDQIDIDCCQQEQRSFRLPARPHPDETCACLAVSIWIDEIERERDGNEDRIWPTDLGQQRGRTNRTSLSPSFPNPHIPLTCKETVG